MKRKLSLILAGIIGVATISIAGSASATPAPSDGSIQTNGSINLCVRTQTTDTHYLQAPNAGATTCPTGYNLDTFVSMAKFQTVTNALQAAIAAVPAGAKGDTGAKGDKGDMGATGPVGPAGTSAILTLSASTAVSNRGDSGHGGDWATDAFQRTASITRQHAAAAAKCGASATECWFYTGTVTDSGSFLTLTGASSPEAGTTIAGNHVAGTFTGGSSFEFYASSDTPNASLVPATLTGNNQSTGTWMRQFFAAGTSFAGEGLPKWSWTYAAPATCEVWVNGSTGDTGDILGVNAC